MTRTPVEELSWIDAAAKTAGVPVYQFWGGPVRTRVRVLTPLGTGTPDELKRAWDQGARAFAVPPPQGVAARRLVPEVVQRLETLRKTAGDGADFVLSCGGSLTPPQAAQVSRALEGFHLLWIDEPCPARYVESVRKVADETVVPLGFGGTLEEMRDLLKSGVVGILRPDLAALGIGNVRKIAALAETYYVAVAPVAREGANWQAAAVHVAASMPNFFAHESAVLPLQDGYLPLSPKPGFGVTL